MERCVKSYCVYESLVQDNKTTYVGIFCILYAHIPNFIHSSPGSLRPWRAGSRQIKCIRIEELMFLLFVLFIILTEGESDLIGLLDFSVFEHLMSSYYLVTRSDCYDSITLKNTEEHKTSSQQYRRHFWEQVQLFFYPELSGLVTVLKAWEQILSQKFIILVGHSTKTIILKSSISSDYIRIKITSLHK